MRPAICTGILLILSIAFLIFHEMLMQTWRPMFMLILLSFAIALVLAYVAFRVSQLRSQSRLQSILLSCAAVFLFSIALSVLWAVSEEGLIHYYLATYGPDDTGGRYFYPGNSGMGYARGLSRPFDLIAGIVVRGICFATLLGVPLGFIIDAKNKESEQGGAPNAHPRHAGMLARFARGIRRAAGERG